MAARSPKGSRRRAGPWGPKKAVRGATIHRRSYEVLSREAEECLFLGPEVMSEGSIRHTPDGASWFGSTMITIDLEVFGQRWRGPWTSESRDRLLQALPGSVRVRLRAMRLACAEVARRLPDRPLGTAQVDTRVRVVGDKLHLDVDVEVPIDVSSAQGKR